MYKASAAVTLPTSIIGSLPRPSWYTAVLGSQSFLEAMVSSRFREQYEDAVSCFLRAQEIAGLDICTDGDAPYDEQVTGMSWQGYPVTHMDGFSAAAEPTVTIRRPKRRRPVFHPLAVTAIDRLTDDAVAVTLAVPEQLREEFSFSAGQHLTLRRGTTDQGEIRRSYSICSPPSDVLLRGVVRIGVREVDGGIFSRFAARDLRIGDTIDTMESNSVGWATEACHSHVRMTSTWSCPLQVGVTGMNLGLPVVPLVWANITGSSAVKIPGSPATTRSISARMFS